MQSFQPFRKLWSYLKFSGIFDRHPGFARVLAEGELRISAHRFGARPRRPHQPIDFRRASAPTCWPVRPSHYRHANCWATRSWTTHAGSTSSSYIGADSRGFHRATTTHPEGTNDRTAACARRPDLARLRRPSVARHRRAARHGAVGMDSQDTPRRNRCWAGVLEAPVDPVVIIQHCRERSPRRATPDAASAAILPTAESSEKSCSATTSASSHSLANAGSTSSAPTTTLDLLAYLAHAPLRRARCCSCASLSCPRSRPPASTGCSPASCRPRRPGTH